MRFLLLLFALLMSGITSAFAQSKYAEEVSDIEAALEHVHWFICARDGDFQKDIGFFLVVDDGKDIVLPGWADGVTATRTEDGYAFQFAENPLHIWLFQKMDEGRNKWQHQYFSPDGSIFYQCKESSELPFLIEQVAPLIKVESRKFYTRIVNLETEKAAFLAKQVSQEKEISLLKQKVLEVQASNQKLVNQVQEFEQTECGIKLKTTTDLLASARHSEKELETLAQLLRQRIEGLERENNDKKIQVDALLRRLQLMEARAAKQSREISQWKEKEVERFALDRLELEKNCK